MNPEILEIIDHAWVCDLSVQEAVDMVAEQGHHVDANSVIARWDALEDEMIRCCGVNAPDDAPLSTTF